MVVVGILIGASIWISHAAEKMDAEDDPKHVVIDEICGMAVALSGLPFVPAIVIGAFAVFRMFDKEELENRYPFSNKSKISLFNPRFCDKPLLCRKAGRTILAGNTD